MEIQEERVILVWCTVSCCDLFFEEWLWAHQNSQNSRAAAHKIQNKYFLCRSWNTPGNTELLAHSCRIHGWRLAKLQSHRITTSGSIREKTISYLRYAPLVYVQRTKLHQYQCCHFLTDQSLKIDGHLLSPFRWLQMCEMTKLMYTWLVSTTTLFSRTPMPTQNSQVRFQWLCLALDCDHTAVLAKGGVPAEGLWLSRLGGGMDTLKLLSCVYCIAPSRFQAMTASLENNSFCNALGHTHIDCLLWMAPFFDSLLSRGICLSAHAASLITCYFCQLECRSMLWECAWVSLHTHSTHIKGNGGSDAYTTSRDAGNTVTGIG